MRVLLVPSLVALLAASVATPALSLDFFGLKLFESQAEEDAEAVIGTPQDYILTFEASGPTDGAVRNASNLLADQNKPASGVAGLVSKAQGDYRRILAALYEQGYYGGAISIQINGVEASKLQPDSRLPNPADVRVVVNAGPQFIFGDLRVANAAAPAIQPDDVVAQPHTVGFMAGEIARSTVISNAERLLVNAWRQQGYADAEIASRDVIADHDTNRVDVTLVVAPGRKAYIGDITVTGTENMDPDFVRRQTGLVEGQEYDPDDIDLANRRLNRLEVFRSMRIEAAEAIPDDGMLPFGITVQEQPLRRFGLGATFSSIDGVGVEGFWLHRNLFGQAERLRLDARIASIAYPIDTEEFDYAIGGTFTKPGIYGPDVDFVASISAERTLVDTYLETSATARVGFTQVLTGEIAFEGNVFVERAQFEDDYGLRDFNTAGLYVGATFDNRDSTTDPTEGFYLNGTIEPFYEFYYGNSAARATIEARTYLALDSDAKYILAGRVKAGYIAGPELSEIPPDRLFFAGGAGSVRGYGYKSIGVTNPDGKVSGGRYLLEGSVEARVKVTDTIGVVGFVDGGYVAADTFPGWDDLYLGAGLGVRYYTGFGPLRLDVAIPLNKRETDPDYAIYVGIGQAF